ncbi:MAG TPA: hypothetical protein VFE54_10520 [Mucilaginibacter sp.]|jgi:hypothetical protein|nr:hypothetical protein [Mucilaginibacter sp.]
MNDKPISDFLKKIVVLSNMTFISWLIYNGITDLFATSTTQLFCSVGLVGMLGINIILLTERRRQL